VPSLWLAGSRDRVMQPRYVHHLAGYSPDHQLAILPGLGHLPMVENPRELAALIDMWLEEELELPAQTQGPQSVASPFSCSSASWA
jgi:2-succinyl-6-hydroxy-2,4-cyclohexadiene-1-carboxylate synthase